MVGLANSQIKVGGLFDGVRVPGLEILAEVPTEECERRKEDGELQSTALVFR